LVSWNRDAIKLSELPRNGSKWNDKRSGGIIKRRLESGGSRYQRKPAIELGNGSDNGNNGSG